MGRANTPGTLANSSRVESDAIAETIDAITAGLDHSSSTSVYQYLGQRLGVHPTTLLRYHRGNLRTAPAVVLAEARALLKKVEVHGVLPTTDGPGDAEMIRRPTAPRVPSWRLAHLFDRLIETLELTEPSALHRLLAIETAIHPTTVLRIHRGILRSAPQILLSAAVQLEERIRAGEAIRFPHSTRGTSMVTRQSYARAVDALMETGLFPDRNRMLHSIEDKLGIPRGRLTRLYRCQTFRWVQGNIQAHLEQMLVKCQYDPSLIYKRGDCFHHHLFGAGVVVSKQPVDKIRVAFADGSTRILRERLREDGYWLQPPSSPGFGESYAVGVFGR